MRLKKHELKTWPEYFEPILYGLKSFEIRKNDRDFNIGDVLVLREYEPNNESYSGRVIEVLVDYIMKPEKPYVGVGPAAGISDEYILMSIRKLRASDPNPEGEKR